MGLPSQYFRAGSGAVIFDRRGLVLALQRADIPGAWQLPQGGLESDEEPLHAALREIAEETGIDRSELKLLDTFPEPLVYELPARTRSEKTGRGQVQYWFLFRFHGKDDSINVNAGDEFRAWNWIPFEGLLNSVADFRKSLYRRLADRFAPHISRAVAAEPNDECASAT
jgi:putative (di)nucleoside polyphosphate hydrolase